MQLNISTDYAIRTVLFLALHPGIASAADIAEAMSVPLNTCKKNLQLLKNAGLISSHSGINGGYFLGKNPSDIHISDILNAVGEKYELNRCLEEDRFCNRGATDSCTVRAVYSKAQAALNEAFNTTIAQLVECNSCNNPKG